MRVLIIAAVLMLAFGIIYGALRERIGCRSLVFKALATFMAVFLGMYGAIRFGGMTGTLVSFGLVLCMAADVALELDFVKGILLFGLAHICFITAFNRLARPEWYTVAGAAAVYLLTGLQEERRSFVTGRLFCCFITARSTCSGRLFSPDYSRFACF